MAVDVSVLFSRYNKLTTEVEVRRRKLQEEATKLVTALRKIAPEDVQLLKKYVPEIEEIITYTTEQVVANKRGELDKIATVFTTACELMDSWMKYYEDSLC